MDRFARVLSIYLVALGTTGVSAKAQGTASPPAQSAPLADPQDHARPSAASGSATHDERQAGIDSDTELAQIVADCKSSNKACVAHFERYARSQKEHSASGGFSLFGLFKGSGLTFWGASEELNYTELVYPAAPGSTRLIEFQVGYGYLLYAKQRDAKVSGDTIVSSLALAGDLDAKRARYSASVIGIAPADEINCATETKFDDKPAAGLLCALDMQPTVTQSYFQTSAARLAIAYDNWRKQLLPPKPPAAAPATFPAICPQVINFRYQKADEKGDRTVPNDKDTMEPIARQIQAINRQLVTICANKMPNAHVTFKTGRGDSPDAAAGFKVGDGGAKVDSSQVTEGYYRNQNFLANTNRRREEFYADSDQWMELSMSGLKDSATLPSILASIVTYTRSDLTQNLRVRMYCSKGTTQVGGSENPMSNPVAFTELVDNIRTAVDGPLAPAATCIDNIAD